MPPPAGTKGPLGYVHYRQVTLLNADQVRGVAGWPPPEPLDGVCARAAAVDRVNVLLAAARVALHDQSTSTPHTGPAGKSDEDRYLAHQVQRVARQAARHSALVPAFEKATSGPSRGMRLELALRLSTEFLCADLGISTAGLAESEFSAQSWIDFLDHHRKAIFDCANYAQKSLDHVRVEVPKDRATALLRIDPS